MREETRARAALVVGLVAAGALLGVAGAAVGVDDPGTDGAAAEFVVADGVSVESGGERATLVSNATEFEAVEIEREGDGFTVETVDALNASQRERARAVARENETVAAHLASLEDYEVAVEPVPVLDASSAVTVEGDVESSNDTGGTFTVSNVSVEDTDGEGVTVESARSYADDRAVVLVQRPDGGDREFVAHVDLANETVTRIVDRTGAENQRQSSAAAIAGAADTVETARSMVSVA